ncbi:MAG: MarR family transcriptional regulator, partial [Mycobacteriales bacterium]
LNCLNILGLNGASTPGGLAAATGLTSASITAVVDRLESKGYVRRERDPHDRRKVVVRLSQAVAAPECSDAFEPVLQAWREAIADFSDSELGIIIEHYQRVEDVTRALLEAFKENPPETGPARFDGGGAPSAGQSDSSGDGRRAQPARTAR